MSSGTGERFRIFRAEKTYAVKAGRWYFEFEAVTAGDMRVGWSRPGCQPDLELGSDERAFAFDGFKVSSFAETWPVLLAWIPVVPRQLHSRPWTCPVVISGLFPCPTETVKFAKKLSKRQLFLSFRSGQEASVVVHTLIPRKLRPEFRASLGFI